MDGVGVWCRTCYAVVADVHARARSQDAIATAQVTKWPMNEASAQARARNLYKYKFY